MAASVTAPRLIFCPPPPGKADTSKPLDPNLILRSRVALKPKGEGFASYQALKIIRQHIGKYPVTPEQQKKREFECLLKAKHKVEKEHSIVFHKRHKIIMDLIKTISRPINPELAKKMLCGMDAKSDPLYSLMEKFSSQDEIDDLVEYSLQNYRTNFIKVNEEFLKKLGKNPQAIFEEKRNSPFHFNFINEKTLFQFAVISSAAFKSAYENYDLKKSSWSPSQGTQSLITEIENHGPLFVMGKFGQHYYKEKAVKLSEQVEGRSVFGWPKNAERVNSNAIHAIIVVGASDTGHVYFIDPADGSDPNSLESQIIYKMSIERFNEVIYDLDCVQFPISEKNLPNYALYGNPKVNYL